MLWGGVTLLGWELGATLPKANGAWNPVRGAGRKVPTGEQILSSLWTFLKPWSLHKDLPRAAASLWHSLQGCGTVKASSHGSDGKSSRERQGMFRCHFLDSEGSFGLLHVDDPLHALQVSSRAEPKQIFLCSLSPKALTLPPLTISSLAKLTWKKHSTKLRNYKNRDKMLCSVL